MALSIGRWIKLLIRYRIGARNKSLLFNTNNGADVDDIVTSIMGTAVISSINVLDNRVALQQSWFAVGRHPTQWLPWSDQEAIKPLGKTKHLDTL